MDLEAKPAQGRLKIVLFTYDFPPFAGGISTYARNLAAGLSGAGHEVHVVCPGRPWDASLPGVSLHRFDGAGSDLRRYRKGLAALEKAVGSLRPDVLHALSSVAHLALGRMDDPGIPRVVTLHGTEVIRNLNSRGLRLRDRLYRPAYLATDRMICVSRCTRSLAESSGLPAEKLEVVYNGVDARPQYHPPEAASELRARYGLFGKKVVLTIAHLHPRKGQLEVLRAMPEILRAVPEAVYVMVGGGESLTDHRLEAHSMGVDAAVRFCGEVADAASFFMVADALVQFSLPAGSFIEGFGLSVAEAMAEGVPVIVSDTGGLPEVVEDGKSGLVVPSSEPGRLAHAVTTLLGHPDRAGALGEAGQARVRALFSLDRFTRETVEAYGRSNPGSGPCAPR